MIRGILGNEARMPDAAGEGRRGLFYGALVAALAVLVYANSLGIGFVWDDESIIKNNPALHGTVSSLFDRIDTARETEITPYYRPVTLLTFLAEERLHGRDPFWMHFFNIFLHALNSFLVYRLTIHLVNHSGAALAAALLFACHPINAESVDFLSARNTILSGFFVLAAYLLHRRSVSEAKPFLAGAGALCFTAALFSKETAVAVLPFILFLEYVPYRSFSAGERFKIFLRTAPYLGGTVIYMIMRSIALSNSGTQAAVLPGIGSRLLENWYIIPRYLLSLLWPISVSMRYYIPDDLHLLALPLFLSWLCIIVTLCWLFTKGRSRATIFGVFWLIAFWLPVSGIIPFPSAPLADRYLYIPAIGLWIILADQFVRITPSGSRHHRHGTLAFVLVLLALSAVTVIRNLDWRNDVVLFSQYVEKNPDSAFGHHNLGCAYMDKTGDLDSAEKEFEKALALDPFFPRLRTQMGYIQFLRGSYEEAIMHYNEAIEQNPFDAEALLNRALSLDRLGRHEAATVDYKRFLATPGNELPQARAEVALRISKLPK